MSHHRSDLTRREFSGVLFGGAIGVLAGRSCLAAATEATEPGDFFFIVAADPQLFWGSEADWARAVEHVNRLKPPLAVVCGDLINRNGDAKAVDLAADERMAQAYLRVARTVDPGIRLYNVAGNHDVCNQPTPETLEWYQERFGKLWYSFTHAGCLFIVLESDVLAHPDSAPEMAQRQMAWLRETLDEAARQKYRHKMVFMHHPLCLKQADEPDGYFNVPLTVRRDLLKLFHEHHVRAVFSGHYHRNALVKDGELELITTSSSGKALGDDPLGMRIVKVHGDRIEHAYHGFEQLPDRVEM
jgi:3',5'-cyclic AMP phosphodiesterase CpdA